MGESTTLHYEIDSFSKYSELSVEIFVDIDNDGAYINCNGIFKNYGIDYYLKNPISVNLDTSQIVEITAQDFDIMPND
ncbi:MAG: hypothetical protein GY756_13485 [bacterium]|nr:hypothetical protein [bacterium]